METPTFSIRNRRIKACHFHLIVRLSFFVVCLNVGPTVRIASVHRFATFSTTGRSPHVCLNVGPTVRIASVHRFATFRLPAGPPTSVYLVFEYVYTTPTVSVL